MVRRREDLGGFFVIGFHGKSPDAALRDILRTCRPCGVILFSRNLEDPAQIRDLTDELQSVVPDHPLLVCVDQEGGRVWRMPPPFTFFPEAACLGRLGSEPLARSTARVLAAELAAVGIHCNLAPVLDLNTNPGNPVIGDRALGTDPLRVARLARAMLLGFRDHGVAGCGKHFPGHGDTEQDSHRELPVVRHPRGRLEAVELAPYRHLLRDPRSPLELIMTAHLLVPDLDPVYPATLSARILRGLLRKGLGYPGAIITDDLEMAAIAQHYAPEEAALLALRAGADLLLSCHTPSLLPRLVDSLHLALRAGEMPPVRLRQAHRRVERLRRRVFQRFPSRKARGRLYARIGSEAHRAVADRVRAAGASTRPAPPGRPCLGEPPAPPA